MQINMSNVQIWIIELITKNFIDFPNKEYSYPPKILIFYLIKESTD